MAGAESARGRAGGRLFTAGDAGRALGATHAVRFPPPPGEWGWWPDLGRLVAPGSVSSRLPRVDDVDAAIDPLPRGTALVGPVPVGGRAEAESIAALLLAAGWGVAVLHVAFPGDASLHPSPLRFDFADGFASANDAAGVPRLVPVFPEAGLAPPLLPGDRIVPLDPEPGNLQRLARWAEETGRLDPDRVMAIFSSEASAARVAGLPPLAPLDWPAGFPDAGSWVAGRLRGEALLLALSGAEGASSELFAAARRVESLVPGFDRIVEAGLLDQVPGFAGPVLDAVRRAVATLRGA